MTSSSVCPDSTSPEPPASRERQKFTDSALTADGSRRAWVDIDRLETVWFNTGTLCNIECINCYIESSPANDRLQYLTVEDVRAYLDEIEREKLPVREIGFTGGEPFLNPDFLDMLDLVMERGFEALVLTNAMRPMTRPQVQERLGLMIERFGRRLQLRVSLDHYTRQHHESERGEGSWRAVLEGLGWLASSGARISVAGRSRWGEGEAQARIGYRELFDRLSVPCNASDPAELVIFPEMDLTAEVPEITVDCWKIVGVAPSSMMCATSRMVVRRKGAPSPVVVACTLLPYEPEFELGASLTEALHRVSLNHPHCAKFCVLGGGSCSV